ncbi:MAG: hypothetical protein A2161_10355 [Candidatus Schekmanbacteria bacterium RBG_13_48_7]|uniref:Uncharacterized protein n=1 Tax=Candidatus Schekmanbacteria bacterium RBG_13_48_7 TaxID=1817878 RepID=A0A1F7S0M3_9BACT|nr:MAG: hypothetical protein A2161_10355 [Candidatus Schekmanbacteria bacterium RBG_13_48_7]
MTMKQSILWLAGILLLLPVIVSGQSVTGAPVLADPPALAGGPDILDYSGYGYVNVLVLFTEYDTNPLEGADVYLLKEDGLIEDYKLTDASGQLEFAAPAGIYYLGAYYGTDYREQMVVLEANKVADGINLIFSYNPGTFGSMFRSKLDPVCFGPFSLQVLKLYSGYVALVPDVEVQILLPDNTLVKAAMSNYLGEVTFLLGEGFYKVRVTVDDIEQTRLLYMSCTTPPKLMQFLF